MQQSLERMFGRAGGEIPITPSERFEKRMGVSEKNLWFVLYVVIVHFIDGDQYQRLALKTKNCSRLSSFANREPFLLYLFVDGAC